MVNPIPQDFNSVSVYLVVKDALKTMDFYRKAFGAEGGACLTAPDGSVMHAEIRIGNSSILLSQENPRWGNNSAEILGGSPASIHLYVENVDEVVQRAMDAGCKELYPVMDAFWGDRYGKLEDPFGYQWGIATHIEDLSEEELQRRGHAWFAQHAGK